MDKKKKSTFVIIGLMLCVILISGLVFASLAEDLLNQETFTSMDPLFGKWLLSQTSLTGDQAFSVITFLGNVLIISSGTLVSVILLIKKRNWKKIIFLFSAVGGGSFLNLILKNIFQRSRPTFPQAFQIETGFSFPSGHAMISLIFYGAIAWIIASFLSKKRQKVLVFLVAFGISALIGFSRLYLGVHFLSDVLAGWAAGAMWLVICALGEYWYRNSLDDKFSRPSKS